MPLRQVQVLGCDACGAEAVHKSGTKGWLLLPITKFQWVTDVQTVLQRDMGGYFCSITCATQSLREMWTKAGVNVAPVGGSNE